MQARMLPLHHQTLAGRRGLHSAPLTHALARSDSKACSCSLPPLPAEDDPPAASSSAAGSSSSSEAGGDGWPSWLSKDDAVTIGVALGISYAIRL